MRIGFVSTYPPIECGIGTYTEYLNEALRGLQNETFVISQFGAQGEGVFPVFHPQSPAFASDIYHTSIRMTPDVIHIQHEYGLYGEQRGIGAIDLVLRYRLAGVPVVATLHTVNEDLDEREKLILKYLTAESSAVIVHEDFQREILETFFGSSHGIHVIEHGVRETEPVPDAKKKLGLEGKKVVMLCGFFRPTKGFHRIIDLFPRICERDADAVLVVAGKTRNIEFDDYRRRLFTQLNESPVAERITVLRGQFPQYTFDTILSAADVVVLPYDRGAQSGIMAHCLAMNVPVVTSSLPAFRKLLARSGGGLACESDDDYVEAILDVLNNEILRREMKEKMRRYVRGRAAWRLIAGRHLDVYREVITVPYGRARYVYFPEPRRGGESESNEVMEMWRK